MTTCAYCSGPSGRIDYFCAGCCVRLLLSLPFKEQRAAHLESIGRVCGMEHAEAVKAAFMKAWEGRRQ